MNPAGSPLDHADRKLAGSLVVGLAGPWPTADEESWLTRWRPAGVILFARNVTGFTQLRRLCSRLGGLVPGCEIMADHEGGPVSQLASALGRPPAAWTLGTLNDEDLTRLVHQETARRLESAGVHRVLAPCADVMVELRNPVIGVRAFGPDEALVSAHVAASVTGLAAGGILSCLKHWPGHGASSRDSHLSTASVPDRDESVSFLAGITAGADAVMVGHLEPAGGGLPATLDAGKLRAWRQFFAQASGRPVLLFADDVTMGGLRRPMAELGVSPDDGLSSGMVDPADLPRQWLRLLRQAGLDRLLIRGIPWAAFPVDDSRPLGTLPGENPAPDDSPASWPGGPYQDARRRVRARLHPDFFAEDRVLAWLDLTVDDRWEVASPDSDVERTSLVRWLAARFAQVVDLGKFENQPAAPLDRLLVSSHRPLPRSLAKDESLWKKLPPEGVCLALGHPGLAADLSGVLGPGWTVTSCHESLYDVIQETA